MKTLVDLLRHRAGDPERPLYTFLADGEEEAARLTRGELETAAHALAALLAERGATGERALLLYPPGLDFIVAFFGCLCAGTVAVPAYPPRGRRSLPRVEAIASDARAKIVLTTAALLPRVESWLESTPSLRGTAALATDALDLDAATAEAWREPALEASSLAFLQYTSGSTSLPKGVKVSHEHLLHNEGLIQEAFRQGEDTRVVGWLPLHHDMGLIGNVLQPLYSGGQAFLMSPVAFLQRPIRWLRAITRYRASTSGGPNFAYELAADRIAEEDRAGLDLATWEVAFNGSEPVRAATLERFAAAFEPHGFNRRAFFPCYGLAEATLFVSGGAATTRELANDALEQHRVREAEAGEPARHWVSAGSVAGGQEVRIVDPETLEPLPADGVGEIWVRGPSVAGGYWQRQEASEETFGARLADGDGSFLRTGDLGFLDDDGVLFITGRLKDLVILRGRNHYPQDLEASAETSHPDLEPAGGAAFALEDDDAAERLVIVHELRRRRPSGDDLETVAAAVRRAVAEGHEVQVHDVVLIRPGTLPRTTSGKVQRRATAGAYLAGELRVMASSRLEAPPEIVDDAALNDAALRDQALSHATLLALAPEERRPRLVADLRRRTARVARVDPARVGDETPLTALGLDSVAAVELRNTVAETFGVEVDLESFLDGTSLADLADVVLAGLDAAAPTPIIPAEPHPTEYALSHGQRALWFLQRLAPAGAAYNVSLAARLGAGADRNAVERSLGAWLERHPSLRVSVHRGAGGAVQRVGDADFTLEILDARDLDDDAFAARLAEEAHRPFDLERGVFRAWLFERPDVAVLLIVIHHLAIDLWSLVLLLGELAEIYPAARSGAEALLSRPARGYHDYVRFQDKWLAGERGERQWEYWRERLQGVDPALDLPTDRPRPPVQSFRGGACRFRLPANLAARVASLAQERGTTLYAVLLAAFQAFLHRLSGASRIIVGSPLAGRGRPEFKDVVGYFVNPLPLDAELGDRPSFETLIGRASEAARGALSHQDFPASLIVERLGLERDPSRNPLFQTQLVFEKPHRAEIGDLAPFVLGAAGGRLDLGGLELESVELEERAAQFDLSLTLIEDGEGALAASLQYATDLYDAATAERWMGHFTTLLEGLAADPAARVDEGSLLDATSMAAVLELGRAADLPTSEIETTLPELFRAQVETTPEAVALVVGEEELSYAELASRVSALAAGLRARGVGPETVAGVFLRRRADLIVALLAVLEAGGAYLPLDPEYPAERLAFMLEDAGALLVVTEGALVGRLPEGASNLLVDADSSHEALPRGPHPWSASGRPSPPRHLAYVIYTSGSTGRPKGVAIEHRAAAALLAWARQRFPAETRRGILAATSVCFDLSVFEIFLPLTTGGTVILAENALHLPTLPARERVTLINTVPSAITELARRGSLPQGARTINLAGEPLRRELVERLCALSSVDGVYNLYGPSEDTTYSTWERVPPRENAPPSIGCPIAGTRALVLDPHGRVQPIGVPGEICLGGRGLARGYLGRASLTAERFVPAADGGRGERLYRTGDLARWGPDGRLHLLGRFDHQVKVRGFRIELGEIEAALHALPEVGTAAVVVRTGALGDARIVAYLTFEGGEKTGQRDLAARLGQRLPAYMVPQVFVVLDALPLTPSGKIDRRALPEPSGERPDQAAAFAPPTSEMERRLAELWRGALGISRVGIDDNFFDLGGHSLLMVELGAQLEETLGRELPVVELFQYPTVRSLARHLEGAKTDGEEFAATRERAARRRRVPARRRRR